MTKNASNSASATNPKRTSSNGTRTTLKAAKSTGKAKRTKKSTSKPTSRAQKIDPKKPKKPPTAFFYFLEDFRKEYQAQNPDVKSMRDIGKACGEKWKVMNYEGKVKYYDIATEKRAEFERAMADYIKKKESGEESEGTDYD